MRIRRTTTFRLTAMLGLAFIATVCGLLALIYWQTAQELIARSDAALLREAQGIVAAPSPAAGVRAAIAANTSGLSFFALTDAKGRPLLGNFPAPRLSPYDAHIAFASLDDRRPPLRLLSETMSDGNRLTIGRDISQIENLRRRLLTILATSGVVALAALVVAAAAVGAAPLRRVRAFAHLAEQIAAGDLEQRMPISRRGDELDLIAGTINVMVEEIGRLLNEVKGATDAIAHDLRTPLSNLRGRLEMFRGVGGQSTLDPSEAAASGLAPMIDVAIGDLDDVLARFTGLLRIAELEASGRRAGFAAFDPMRLAAAVCELYEPLAEAGGISLVLTGSWGHVIEGDEKLLFEALGNLVENAIKFIGGGGCVRVEIEQQARQMMLIVRDDGPGILASERAHVLRRFHRGSAAPRAPGSGLGLSLVAAIVHLHGFALDLEDAQPGLLVRISCPAQQ